MCKSNEAPFSCRSANNPLGKTYLAIVNDERNILTSLRTAFEADGFVVNAFLDPLVAMPKLFLVPPQVVLHNGKMPRTNGIEFLLKCDVAREWQQKQGLETSAICPG